MKRKILISILAVAMLASIAAATAFTIRASGAEIAIIPSPTAHTMSEMQSGETLLLSSSQIPGQGLQEPQENYLKYISFLSVAPKIEAGNYHCSGLVKLTDEHTVVMRMYLQRRAYTEKKWTNVSSWEKSITGGSGYEMKASSAISSGYYYRTCVQVDVKNASGGIIETINSYSGVEHY